MPDPVAVNSMFARIARRYDVTNRCLCGGLDVWWRRKLVAAVKTITPQAVLDVATGSGDVAFALGRKLGASAEIVGLDFCQPMLDEAEVRKKSLRGRTRIVFRQGDALALPFADSHFDAVTISFGLRNLADRARALTEMRRILRPGGRVFILEFSQPYRWFRPVYFLYLRHILPVLAGRLTGDRSAYEYLNHTIEEFPGREALSAELARAGFSDIQSRPLTLGIVALHVGKKAN
jgi:demethylmenaquinone methyltransferase/2-methoxy-6-polyprenyl-1,4-benzoquinol methylase